MEIFIRKVLTPQDNWYLINDMLSKLDLQKIKIIALGDSHSANGLGIQQDNFYNFSYGAENVFNFYIKFRYFLRKGLNPNILLLQADYHLFSPYRAPNTDMEKYSEMVDNDIMKEAKRFQIDMHIKEYGFINNYLIQFKNYTALQLHKTLLKYLINGFHIENKFDVTSTGTVLSHEEWGNFSKDNRFIIAKERVKEQSLDKNFNPINYLIFYYEQIIKLAMDHNIKVVMVRYPLSEEYYKSLNSKLTSKMDDIYTDIGKKYNIPIINFTTNFSDKKYFADSDHLNKRGAIIFGNIIIKRINHLQNKEPIKFSYQIK